MPTKTMNAIRLHEFGGPEVPRYEEVPRPELNPGEVLVRIHAVGVNPPHWYLRDGYKALPPQMRPLLPLPVITGSDISLVVEAMAEDIHGFSVGDEVFGMIRFPSYGKSEAYAEYIAVPATDLALKPAGIDHIHAAAAAMSGLTAWQFLIDRGHDVPNPLQPEMHHPVPLDGKTVLVNGAAGGVGHLAVQLAKWKGAYVIRMAPSWRKLGVCLILEQSPSRSTARFRLRMPTERTNGQRVGTFKEKLCLQSHKNES